MKPDTAAMACVVSCCGQPDELDHGRYLNAYWDVKGIGNALMVKNVLVDMYSNCRDIERALQMACSCGQR